MEHDLLGGRGDDTTKKRRNCAAVADQLPCLPGDQRQLVTIDEDHAETKGIEEGFEGVGILPLGTSANGGSPSSVEKMMTCGFQGC